MEIEYKKYRWFFTKSGKLVVGGKSALQNDDLLKSLKRKNRDYIVMHTSSPGSPFSVIISEIDALDSSDLEEAAVFTACFSRAWKSGKKSESVDIFKLSQIYKSKEMHSGTWGVKPKVQRQKNIPLSLVLAVQKGILRSVPLSSLKNKKDALLKIVPGKIDKRDILPKLALELNDSFSQEEILSALPSGGIRVIK